MDKVDSFAGDEIAASIAKGSEASSSTGLPSTRNSSADHSGLKPISTINMDGGSRTTCKGEKAGFVVNKEPEEGTVISEDKTATNEGMQSYIPPSTPTSASTVTMATTATTVTIATEGIMSRNATSREENVSMTNQQEEVKRETVNTRNKEKNRCLLTSSSTELTDSDGSYKNDTEHPDRSAFGSSNVQKNAVDSDSVRASVSQKTSSNINNNFNDHLADEPLLAETTPGRATICNGDVSPTSSTSENLPHTDEHSQSRGDVSEHNQSQENNNKLSREISLISLIGFPDEEEANTRLEALRSAISLQEQVAQLRRAEFQRRHEALGNRRHHLSQLQHRNRNSRLH